MKRESIARGLGRNWMWICFALLLILVSAEFFSCRLFNQIPSDENPSLCAWLLSAALLAIFIFSVIAGIRMQGFPRRPDFQLISNIVHNVTRSHPVAIAILLLFIVNVELFCNSLYDVFSVNGWGTDFWCAVAKSLCPVFATYGSFYLYPKGNDEKPGKERSLLICGLSRPGGKCAPMNINLLCKPFLENYAIQTMVIIPSPGDIHFKQAQLDSDPSRSDLRFFPSLDALNSYNSIVDEYEGATVRNAGETIKRLMQLQINGEIDFEVIVESQVDYDKHEDLLQSIDGVLDKYERMKTGRRETNDTLLYINPGTVAIGSMLAVFAIPGERNVLYFTQTQADNGLVHFGLKTKGMNSIIQEYCERI